MADDGLRTPPHRYIPAAVALLTGVALTLTAFDAVRRWERRRVASQFERLALDRVAAVQRAIALDLEVLGSIGRFYAASQLVERHEFRAFTRDALAQHRAITALRWAPRVAAAERLAHEEAARDEGLADYRITQHDADGKVIPAARREEHFPVYYVESSEAVVRHPLGLDLGANPAYRLVMVRARDRASPMATARIAAGQGALGEFDVLVFFPIYRNDVPHEGLADRRQNLLGFAVGTFRIGRLVAGALSGLSSGEVEACLFDEDAPPDERFLCLHPAPSGEGGAPARTEDEIRRGPHVAADIGVGGRRWSILLGPTERFFAGRRAWGAWGVLGAGALFTALVVAYLARLAGRAARVEHLVARRTGELGRANEDLSREIDRRRRADEALARERNLLRALVENIPDYIYAKDTESRFVLNNAAHVRVLGATDAKEVRGKTDFDFFPEELAQSYFDDEQAIIRSGEPVIGRQEPSLDEAGNSRWVSTTKVPLRDDGGAIVGIVGISRDITERRAAEEALRQARSELEARVAERTAELAAAIDDLRGEVAERTRAEEKTEHVNAVLRAIRTIERLIAEEDDRDRLLQRACDSLVETRGYESAWIALVDDSGDLLTAAASGLGEGFEQLVAQMKRGELPACGRRALDQPGVLAIQERSAICAECPLLPEHHATGAMSVRLEHGGTVYGVLRVSVVGALAADEEEQALFGEIAGDVALALHGIELEAERARAEATVRESQQMLQLVMDNIPQFIFWKDTRSVYLGCNRNFARVAGVGSPEDIVGKTDYDLPWKREEANLFRDVDRRVMDADVPEFHVTEHQVQADGKLAWLDTNRVPLHDAQGRTVGILGTYEDITERRQAEEQIRRHNALLHAINTVFQQALACETDEEVARACLAAAEELTHSGFGFLGELNPDGRFDTMALSNPGWEACRLPWSRAAPMIHDMAVRGIWGDVLRAERALIVNDPASHPARVGVPEGHPPLTCFLGVPLRHGGRTTGMIALANKRAGYGPADQQAVETLAAAFMEALMRKRAETALRQAHDQLERRVRQRTQELQRSNRELEEFAYVASHDLQEPLRMVSSFVGLLARDYEGRLDRDADQYIQFAVEGASRMQALINDLLEYSRVGTRGTELRPTCGNAAVDAAIANLRATIAEAGATVTHDALPTILADETQLMQLFQNLIGNAIKFRGSQPPRVHVGASRDDGDWVFSVRDNGMGIAPQFAERIFLIFQRLHEREKYPGTGIGLAICRRIVERHGGRIWLDSAPGEGSTFYFTLHPAEGDSP